MAESSIIVKPGSGGGQDASTQSNLQGSGQTSLDNGLTGKVQPGIASEQLKSAEGISLTPTALSTVDLNGTTSSTTVSTQTAPTPHHFNPLLLGICIVLFVAAIVMFIMTDRLSKNHNQYK